MMESYYIATPITPGNLAGTKARQDIEALSERRGMHRIEFSGGNTANRRLIERVRLVWFGFKNWTHLEKSVAPASLVLFQYPHYPMKSAFLARYMMRRIQRKKQVLFAALVHDLNSVRKLFGTAALYSDEQFLAQFDYVICHNELMCDYLAEQGFNTTRLIPLGVFDYLADHFAVAPESPYVPSVNIAGNLSREKSAYLYSLLNNDLRYRVYLYGSGLDATVQNDSFVFKGFAPPETLPTLLCGAFGLVWDGDSIETCSGDFGAYLAINNPHKLSLYLSAGIPVIIWRGAALSQYIEQFGLGFCIDSLRELDTKLSSISEETYCQLRQNAAREGVKIRRGSYFDQVMEIVETRCFKK